MLTFWANIKTGIKKRRELITFLSSILSLCLSYNSLKVAYYIRKFSLSNCNITVTITRWKRLILRFLIFCDKTPFQSLSPPNRNTYLWYGPSRQYVQPRFPNTEDNALNNGLHVRMY